MNKTVKISISFIGALVISIWLNQWILNILYNNKFTMFGIKLCKGLGAIPSYLSGKPEQYQDYLQQLPAIRCYPWLPPSLTEILFFSFIWMLSFLVAAVILFLIFDRLMRLSKK